MNPYLNFINRWVFSTNHKDISVLYFFFGAFSGILGTAFLIFEKVEVYSSTKKDLPASKFLEVRYNQEKQKITYGTYSIQLFRSFFT